MNPDVRPLIEKFWAGTATPAEQQQLLRHLDAEGSGAPWLLASDSAEAAGLGAPPTAAPLSAEQSARVLRRLHWRLALDAAPPLAPTRPRLRTQAGRARWAAPAVAVLLLLTGLGWLLTRRPAPAPPLAHQTARPVPAQRARPALPSAAPPLIRRTNAGPAPLRLPLPDGSVVTLEAGSTLAYQPFGPASRELSLRGAALFAVAKDAARPFTVAAGGFTTTALGTRFRVESRAGGRVRVRLLTGKVVVRTAAANPFAMPDQYLTPGRELRADTRTRQVHIRAFDSVAVPRHTGTVPAARPRPADLGKPAGPAPAPAARPLTVWVCTWCHETYTGPKQPTSFQPNKCRRNPGKAHAWHRKYPYPDPNQPPLSTPTN